MSSLTGTERRRPPLGDAGSGWAGASLPHRLGHSVAAHVRRRRSVFASGQTSSIQSNRSKANITHTHSHVTASLQLVLPPRAVLLPPRDVPPSASHLAIRATTRPARSSPLARSTSFPFRRCHRHSAISCCRRQGWTRQLGRSTTVRRRGVAQARAALTLWAISVHCARSGHCPAGAPFSGTTRAVVTDRGCQWLRIATVIDPRAAGQRVNGPPRSLWKGM